MRNQHKSSSPYPEWNNKKFEAKLEREIEQRKNLISISANYIYPNKENAPGHYSDNPNDEILESTGIYKQFLLIGVPPSVENSKDPNVKPTVLIAYPPFEYPNMPIKKIIEHCMPTGPSRDFLSGNSLSPIQDEFVFQFGGGLCSEGKPIYGVCVHVSTKCTSLPFYGNKIDKDRVFCFCLMTKMPTFSVHFAFLTSLVLWTIGHVRHLHKYENKIRVNIPPGEPIGDLDLEDQIGHHPSIEVPVSFQNEIASYFISKISSKPEMLSRASSTFMKGYVSRKLEKMNSKKHNFHYDVEDCSIELRFPAAKDISENCIEWASLDTLFSLLSSEDILTVISGLLLDRQVLIIGSRLEEVSMTVWALKSILKPFKFAGTVIPILPTTSEDYIGLLQLPTPFLIGVPRCNELKVITFLETAVFVDLDKRNVPPIENLPGYPNENYVRSKLNKFISSIKSKKESNEFGLPAIYRKTLNHKYVFSTDSCSKINEIISSPFEKLIYSNYFCGFFVSAEGVTVFNEEIFLYQILSFLNSKPEELYGETLPYPIREKEKEKKINEEFAFWNNIVESQTFQMYTEERMQSFMETKNRAVNCDNLAENEEEKKDEKNEDDIQKIAQLSEENIASDNNDFIKDIEKNKNAFLKKQTLYNFDQIENEIGVPRSVPPKISMNRKKIQLRNPQRNKSLKNVLDDLPTPCSSNNKLLDLNEDRVKSDPEAIIEDNENKKIPNKKIRKSSTLAAINRSDFLLEGEDNEKEDKKSTKKEKVNNDKNKQQQKQRKSSKSSDHDDENSDEEAKKQRKSNDAKQIKAKSQSVRKSPLVDQISSEEEEEITKKHRKSSSKDIKQETANQVKKTSSNDKINDENKKVDEDESKKHRKSDDKKITSKSQKTTRTKLDKSDDQNSSNDEETTKKIRKSSSNEKRQTSKQVKKTSSNDKINDESKKVDEDESKKHRKSDDKKTASKSQKTTRTKVDKSDDQSISDDEEITKKRMKSSQVERTTSRSQKPTRNRSAKSDDQSNSDDDEINKKRRKSSKVERTTSRSQRPTRTSSNNNDDDQDSDEEITKRQRKSSQVERTTSRSQKPTRTASNNNDDDQDSDEEITKKQRKSSEAKQTKSRSQRPSRTASNKEDSLDEEIENELNKRRRKTGDTKKHTRKSSSTNDDEDENDNKKLRRSRSSRPTGKSSNDNDEDDEELIKERSVKLRKSSSNEKTKPTRKSSNDNDEDDNAKEKKLKKSVSNNKFKPARKSSSNDADEELKNQSKSTQIFDVKAQRKSNVNDNIRTKPTKNLNPLNKKTSNPTKNLINKPRSKTIINKNDSNKKKLQLQFNSSSEYETYSSDSFDPNLYYANEEMDKSSEGYDD